MQANYNEQMRVPNADQLAALREKSSQIRVDLLSTIFHARAGHTGGALSSVDILVSLFYGVLNYRSDDPAWPERDRFILSKGHSCEGYYATLADCGFYPKSELEGFMGFSRMLTGHPHTKIPGVEVCSGSLGHGLSVATGMALAAKMDHQSYRVFCLLGDGELAEGSVWEAAAAAGHYGLDNLICIVDRNGLQITGQTEDVLGAEPLNERWKAFKWSVKDVDGHDHEALVSSLNEAPVVSGKPTVLIARTIKGKGVSFIEGDPKWHHKVPTQEQYELALKELQAG